MFVFLFCMACLLTRCLAVLCGDTPHPSCFVAEDADITSVYSVCILCQYVTFSYASRFLKIHKHSAFEGAVCNLFKMFGVFGSSVTSSLSDVCQCNPVPFCKTSNELNIICQCHMKAECVFSRIRRS